MKKFYYRLLRDVTAMKLLAALVANPSRYDYIAALVEEGGMSNRAASDKNITKAIIMADQFVEGIQQRNTLDK